MRPNLFRMPTLHNRISKKLLKEKAATDTIPKATLSFYCYFPIQDPQAFRDQWYIELDRLGVKGRIYVAREGINAQVSCPIGNLDAFREFIYGHEPLEGLRLNKAVEESRNAFYVLNIKVRNKIVADGISDPGFSMEKKGRYVNAQQFNDLVKDPDTLVIDMRNHYEFEVGRFNTAMEIPSDTFREQLPMAVDMFRDKKDKNIIMYCTGGIRCEKASAWMLHNGFKNVFHLEGGIINYFNQVKEQNLDNHFIGKNFVFDERLGERITDDVISSCHLCGKPCDNHVNCVNSACHLLFIQCDECKKKYEGCCSKACQDFIHLDEVEQKNKRKGIDKGRNIFNKSKEKILTLNREAHQLSDPQT